MDFETELKEKINQLTITKVSKDAYLLIEGEFCPGVPLIIEGQIKIIKEEVLGKELVLYRINPGESCIMSITSSMLDKPIEASAITESDVSMYMIPTEVSREWMKRYDSWSNFILKTTNLRYFEMLRLVHDISFKSTGERLLNWLNNHQDESGLIQTKHEILAKELGTAREVISRLLKAYAKRGLLSTNRGFIQLHQC